MAKTTTKSSNGKPELFFSQTMRSPKGSALFAKLIEPDIFKGGDPTWKITLVFSDTDPEFLAFKDVVEKFAKTFSKQCGKPVDPAKSFGSDRDTGMPTMTFKSKARLDDAGKYIPIAMVDANKAAVTREPWNGDECRVAFKFGGWESALGVGIKPYLSAVQVVSRAVRSSGSGFAAVNVFDSASTVATLTEDELPF